MTLPEPTLPESTLAMPRKMTRRQRRLVLIGAAGLVLGLATFLVLNAMRDSLVFFHAPTAVIAKNIAPGMRFRLGGLVEQGSVIRGLGQAVSFRVTDGNKSIPVTYTGLIPDLFREGQGIVAEGKLDASGLFSAQTLLARHDENYMPREVADALKAQGQWKPGDISAKGKAP
jgi:cytochrome c-type biogenesis protein CcmE